MKRLVAAFLIGTLLLAGVSTSALARSKGRIGAFVTGGGNVILTSTFGRFAGDRVHISLNAHRFGTGAVRGRFILIQHSTNGGLIAHFAGQVTCLAVTGHVAQVTGVIKHGADNFGANPVGKLVAITVDDRGPGPGDMLGFATTVSGGSISACQAVPATLPVRDGDFMVHP